MKLKLKKINQQNKCDKYTINTSYFSIKSIFNK